MSITDLLLDVSEAFLKTYYVIRVKPYVTVKVQIASQSDRPDEQNDELITLTIINEGIPDIDIERVWFLTSYNRPIFSELIDSKMPERVLENNRATYLIPIGELKASLNKIVGETIVKAVVLDKTGLQYTGRISKAVQGKFAE